MGQSESRPVVGDGVSVTSCDDVDPTTALNSAEAIDGYWAAISNDPINRLARENYSYRAITGMEITSTEEYDTSGTFPKGRIITMMPSAEAGFPHTRGKDIICIPAYYPKNRLPTIIIHELIHLHQKALRKEYEDFYETVWDFKPVDESVIPESIRRRRRLNPDTIGWPTYIWKNKWIPLCLFEREDRPNMRECSYYWYDPHRSVLRRNVDMIPAWREFFGTVDGAEHPNELAAYYGSEVDKYNLGSNPAPAVPLFYSFLFKHKNSRSTSV